MNPQPVRLRQLVVATSRLDPVVAALEEDFELVVSDRIDGEPSHDEFALRSATLVVGSQFVEVIEPVRPDAPAARHLARLGGDGGYMIILEVPSSRLARARAEELGLRVIWEGGAGVHAVHLHPKDTSGALLSLAEARPRGTWSQGGPTWERDVRTTVADGIAAASIACRDPEVAAASWARLLELPAARCEPTVLHLDDASIRFELAVDGTTPHGPTAVDLEATRDVTRGTTRVIGGVTFRLV